MTALLNRSAADALLAELDLFVRAALPVNGEEPEDDADGETIDPEEAQRQILEAVREQLDWDGVTGDPNASKDALEDALGDMFDADVEILWNGKDALTLQVEGEQPVPLTPDYLGELLEALAKQGAEDGTENEDDTKDGQDGQDGDQGERRHDGWRRAVVDKHGHHHDPGGEGGGRFVSKGAAAAGAAGKAAKAAGKAAGGKGAGRSGGPKSTALAKRASGRAGPRATAKAVGNALSAGTGSRVKVSGNKDGSFNVGPQKKKMSGKKLAKIIVATWLAFSAAGFAAGFAATVVGIPIAVVHAGLAAASVAAIVKIVRSARG